MNKWNLEGVAVDTADNMTVSGSVTATGFVGDVTGDVTGDLTGNATVPTVTVATLPDAVAGGIIYVSDGKAGDPVLSFSDGTNWLRCDTLAAVSAT